MLYNPLTLADIACYLVAGPDAFFYHQTDDEEDAEAMPESVYSGLLVALMTVPPWKTAVVAEYESVAQFGGIQDDPVGHDAERVKYPLK